MTTASSPHADPSPSSSRGRRQALALYLLVLWSGGSIMALEMTGAKLLDSVYGSTIYVWGSILSLITTALAAGYFFGGKIADKAPKFSLLAGIATLAGVFTLFVPFVAKIYFPMLPDSKFGVRLGPLIAGVTLFAIPCFLYGTISPFALKLRARELSGLGHVTGRLYSLSTLGSIIGTLLTSFVLLIFFGKLAVLVSLGSGMILIAAATYLIYRSGTPITESSEADTPAPDTSKSENTPSESNRPATGAGETIQALTLYWLVIFAGIALMGLELCGAKILEASYGSTVYLWGAVIGLFMGALSLGYFLGGMVSDRFPSFALMTMILGLAGAFTAFTPFLSDWYLGAVSGSNSLTFKTGPLVGSVVLFTIPGILYGMIPPFAIRLRAKSLTDLGRLSGRVYALNTFGSLIGTLLVTFVLISIFGKKPLALGIGLAVIIVAVTGYVAEIKSVSGALKPVGRLTIGVFVVFMLGLIALAVSYEFGPKKNRYPSYRVLWFTDSPYHEISVQDRIFTFYSDTIYVLNRPEDVSRFLKFNKQWESGVFPNREGCLLKGKDAAGKTHDYFHYDIANSVFYTDLFHLAMLYIDDPASWVTPPGPAGPEKRVLFVGGGGGIGPEQFCSAYANCNVDVAELDPSVEKICKRFFGVRGGDPRLTFTIGDGRLTLDQSSETYDIIFLDAFSSGGRIPGHLVTAEFLELCRSKLKKDQNGNLKGILVTNLITANKVDPAGKRPDATRILSSFTKTIRTFDLFDNVFPFIKIMDSTFDRDRLLSTQYVDTRTSERYDPYKPDNVIVVCFNSEPGRPMNSRKMRDKMRRLTQFGKNGEPPIVKIPFTVMGAHINNWIRDNDLEKLVDLPGAVVLTDDYTPTDVMVYPPSD